MFQPKKILVPIDFSDESSLALDWGIMLAGNQLGSSLYLCHILTEPMSPLGPEALAYGYLGRGDRPPCRETRDPSDASGHAWPPGVLAPDPWQRHRRGRSVGSLLCPRAAYDAVYRRSCLPAGLISPWRLIPHGTVFRKGRETNGRKPAYIS